MSARRIALYIVLALVVHAAGGAVAAYAQQGCYYGQYGQLWCYQAAARTSEFGILFPLGLIIIGGALAVAAWLAFAAGSK